MSRQPVLDTTRSSRLTIGTLAPRQPFQGKLVNHSSSLKLLQARFHPRKGTENTLSLLDLSLVVAKELERSLEDFASFLRMMAFLFELCPQNPVLWCWAHGNPSFVDCAGTGQLVVAFL